MIGSSIAARTAQHNSEDTLPAFGSREGGMASAHDGKVRAHDSVVKKALVLSAEHPLVQA